MTTTEMVIVTQKNSGNNQPHHGTFTRWSAQ